MDDECHILGRVVRPGPEGVPQGLLLGVLLALLLLVAVLAAALIFSYWRRKQLGELSTPLPTQPVTPKPWSLQVSVSSFCPGLGGLPTPPEYRAASRSLESLATKGYLSTVLSLNPGDLVSLDRTAGAVPLPVLRLGSDYRNGLGEMGEALKARATPSAPQALTPSPPQQPLTPMVWMVRIPPPGTTKRPPQTVGMGPASHCCGQRPSSLGTWTLRSWPKSRMC